MKRFGVRWSIAAALAVAGVLWLTLRPDDTLNRSNLVPLRDHLAALRCLLRDCPNAAAAARFLLVDVVGNVVVFIPIGAFVAAALGRLAPARRILTTLALGAGLSLAIELVQLAMPSRATDVDDVLFNTLGTALGAVLVSLRTRPRAPGS